MIWPLEINDWKLIALIHNFLPIHLTKWRWLSKQIFQAHKGKKNFFIGFALSIGVGIKKELLFIQEKHTKSIIMIFYIHCAIQVDIAWNKYILPLLIYWKFFEQHALVDFWNTMQDCKVEVLVLYEFDTSLKINESIG